MSVELEIQSKRDRREDAVANRVICETAPVGYSIGEPQKNDLSDMGPWLFSFKRDM